MTNRGYYNEKVLNKFNDALNKAVVGVKNGEYLTVKFSGGNTKMGAVPSISLLPFITCPANCKDTCGAKCYAAKLANLRPNVLMNYAINTALAIHRPDLYWAHINDFVNSYIDGNGELPSNLHILFSGWINLKPNNPHNLPETNVFTCEEDFNDDWKVCGGNCFNCACRGVGCWQAQKGDVIAFKMH